MNSSISIPKPCHEDWNKMDPNNEGKFCNSCHKTVVDFTKMSKEEIQTYFKQKAGGNTCGHFYASQLKENIKTKPSVFKRVSYFATIALGLFLPLSGCKKQVTGEPAVIEDKKEEIEITGDTVYTGNNQVTPPKPILKKADKEKENILLGVPLIHPDSLKNSSKLE
jgi:hypothetical protein